MRTDLLAEMLLQKLEPDDGREREGGNGNGDGDGDGHNRRGGAQNVRGSRPINRRLYELIRDAILAHTLPAGWQLPSTRALAVELGLSRNTISYAYEQLLAEGYLESRPASGTFVADTAPIPFEATGKPAPQCGDSMDAPLLSRRGAQLIAQSGAGKQQWGAFMPGVPDLTQFPKRAWARLQNKHWLRADIATLTYGQGGGHLPLREEIAQHVRIARAVNCNAGQVIITSGIHQSIDLITRLLGEAGDQAWVEEPCYWGTRNVLASLGMNLLPVAVDHEGIQIPHGGLHDDPKFMFTTPSHQYPLGVVMSLSRRRALIEFAAAKGAWIVEDDYDSEFRYAGPSLASLQGLDRHERVIYMGTFSKTLFPGLRIGFVIVPHSLAEVFSTGVAELYRGGQVQTQAILADFMAQGHYASHVRKMKMCYAARLKLLRAAIAQHLGGMVEILGDAAGLHLTLALHDTCDDTAISRAAELAGIIARPLSAYYMNPQQARCGLILGYACVADEEIEPALGKLARIIHRHIREPRDVTHSLDGPAAPAWSATFIPPHLSQNSADWHHQKA